MVRFTYSGQTYKLPGDSSVALSVILDAVGLKGEVENVMVSNSNLFSASKDTGEWIIKANQVFDTTEHIYVSIKGTAYDITVTSKKTFTLTLDPGKNGTLAVKVDGEAATGNPIQVPENAVVGITATPEEHYVLTSLNYRTDEPDAKSVDVTGDSFNMPAANTTLTAVFTPQTAYIDETGATQYHLATKVTSDMATTFKAGWYCVDEDVTIGDRIYVRGDVNLILCDGAALHAPRGINVSEGNSLTIWGQAGDTGALTIDNVSSGYAGIGGDERQSSGTVTIHGGTVRTKGNGIDSGGAGIGGGCVRGGVKITITGGRITATGGSGDKYIGTGIGGFRLGSSSSGASSITMSLANDTDFIKASSYGVFGYPVKIPAGKSLRVLETGEVIGPSDNVNTSGLGGKTLVKNTTLQKDRENKPGESSSLKKGASARDAEKIILAMKNDKDPDGSAIMPLQLRSTKQTKKALSLKWRKQPEAKKYVIYGNRCGTKNKMKKLATTAKTRVSLKKIAGKKVKKGTYYKFIMVAVDKNGKVVSTSKVIHVASKGGKAGNPTKLTIKKPKKSRVTLKKGKTATIKAKQTKSKKVKKHASLRYESSNTKIATVSSKGKIKAVKKGTCKVYVYTQNGLMKTVQVGVN